MTCTLVLSQNSLFTILESIGKQKKNRFKAIFIIYSIFFYNADVAEQNKEAAE